ncbi:GNAT family N-acetyltransferase [Mycobacterium sp. Aquia_216]|uniref:GNAT family N-acetyltransferase, cg3035/Rv0428c family n=1 Tax=Mycobacterium sp. Aquia_216 TaxID=2991729 RepID=UPI00227AFB05|nr:GNAT family N-acetyltransferase [Mycobacterium sp. Aquia_216]WAJ45876.1 GNAT family N-acetyltransferase [Mycobacterium sp. Aquia_216]
MVSWPDLGTRVTVRYRRRPGSVPPLTDAVGHLLAVDPVVRVRTKTDAVVELAAADVVALRVLTDAPVRNSAIRALEHAAATAWGGDEHAWLDGWLLRAGPETGRTANSAVPLDISARLSSVPAIVAWYDNRGLSPRLAIPDRLLALPPDLVAEHSERVSVRDLPSVTPEQWPGDRRLGEFARAAVTDAPDGTRWVGLSEVRAAGGAASLECEELLSWGARRGATRAYLEVAEGADDLAERLGFRLHHRRRYFGARSRAWDTV